MAKPRKKKFAAHPYVIMRPQPDGSVRPRFAPDQAVRDLGFPPQDLKHDSGAWFSHQEACLWARETRLPEIVAARAAGKRLAPDARRETTVEVLLRDWMASDAFKAIASERTRDGYRRQIDAIIFKPQSIEDRRAKAPRVKEEFVTRPVSAIEPPEANLFVEYQIRTRGLYMGRASRAVLVQAFKWGRLSTVWRLKHNPFSGLRYKKPEARLVIWTDAEIRKMVETADSLGMPSIGDSILLGLFTGQRQGDRLRLCDEGLQEGRRVFRQSKTGAIVAIAETPRLRERLEQARARVAAIKLKFGTRPATVIVDEATGNDYVLDTYRHRFDEVRAKAAETMPQIAGKRDQDLRDTAVTWFARASSTIPQICAISGHEPKSVYGILKHYLAITPELADAAIDKLVAWMEREGIAV